MGGAVLPRRHAGVLDLHVNRSKPAGLPCQIENLSGKVTPQSNLTQDSISRRVNGTWSTWRPRCRA